MKAKLFFYLCIFFAGVTLYSCVPPDDVEMRKSVEMEIRKEIPGITASALNGVVTLTGTVNSEEAKTKAGDIAKKVKYVRSVNNSIYINIPQPIVTETPDDIFTKTIKAALNEAGYSTVDVTVKDSVVTLSGEVKKADVEKITQVVTDANPKSIDNQLNVK